MIFRPYTSESGPTRRGPIPRPVTKRLIESMVTSCDTLNSAAMPSSVNEATDEVHAAQRDAELMTATVIHFRTVDRFWGSSSSSRMTAYDAKSVGESDFFSSTAPDLSRLGRKVEEVLLVME